MPLERSQLHMDVKLCCHSGYFISLSFFPLKINVRSHQKFEVPGSLELCRGCCRAGDSQMCPGIPSPGNPSLCASNTWIFSNTLMLLKHFQLFRIRIMESLRLEKTPKVVESNLSLAMLGIPGAEVPELGGGSKAGHQSSHILDLVSFMFLNHLIIHLNF